MKRWLWIIIIPLLWSSAPEAQPTRFVYLSPIDGAGTEEDLYHSRCLGLAGAGNVDLRPWGINRFLCASNVLPADMTGVQQLGSAKTERMTGARKAALGVLAGKGLVADTVDEAIYELLSSKLRAGRDGKLKIWLGESAPLVQQTAWVPFRDNGIVADLTHYAVEMLEPARAWAASHGPDTFTGSNNVTLLGDLTWTEYSDTLWGRTSNRAEATGASSPAAEARADHDAATDDHEVSADITYTWGSGTQCRCGVIARKDSTSTRDFYQFGIQRDSGVDVYRLLERNAGSATTLGDSAGATTTPVTLKVRVDGSSISGFVDGVLSVGPITDATITGNTRGGLAYVGGSGDTCTADNWLIADYTAPAASGGALRRRLQ